jgi:protein-tyrosine phosphatase
LVLPIDDQSDQDLKKYFKQAIEFIDTALYQSHAKGHTAVLVHCAAGISRSGGIVIAYLMWKQQWTFDNAWKYAQTMRPVVYPNMGFQS